MRRRRLLLGAASIGPPLFITFWTGLLHAPPLGPDHAPVRPGVTPEAVQRIRPGMTEGQVEATFGRSPLGMAFRSERGGVVKVWSDEGGAAAVELYEGRVVTATLLLEPVR